MHTLSHVVELTVENEVVKDQHCDSSDFAMFILRLCFPLCHVAPPCYSPIDCGSSGAMLPLHATPQLTVAPVVPESIVHSVKS